MPKPESKDLTRLDGPIGILNNNALKLDRELTFRDPPFLEQRLRFVHKLTAPAAKASMESTATTQQYVPSRLGGWISRS